MVSSLPAEVLQVLQYMYRVHDPAITIAIGSVWLQLSWKRGKTNSLVPDDGYLQVPRKKKLHVQLVYVGDEFKMWKKKCLLCFCHILECHTKIKQMIHGSIEQWGNINGTDRQTYSKLHVIQIKANRLRYMHVHQNMLFFPQKKVLECTSVQENCSYSKTFLNHTPTFSPP